MYWLSKPPARALLILVVLLAASLAACSPGEAPMATHTVVPTNTPKPPPTAMPTATPTNTPAPTSTPVPTPTSTPTPPPTPTPTVKPTEKPKPSPTPKGPRIVLEMTAASPDGGCGYVLKIFGFTVGEILDLTVYSPSGKAYPKGPIPFLVDGMSIGYPVSASDEHGDWRVVFKGTEHTAEYVIHWTGECPKTE